eukprot:jgi/Galph1/496/GphlegSOOS_G5182.1
MSSSASPRSSATFPGSFRANPGGLFRRIAVVGPRGVGKSALTVRFCEGTFHESYLPTIEDTYLVSVKQDGQLYNMEIVDTGGQDEYSLLSSQCTIGVHGYVLVFSLSAYDSFEFLKTLYNRLLTTLGMDTVPHILVGMKLDEEEDRVVSLEQVQELTKEWMCSYVECSAKDGTNVNEVFETLLREIEKPTIQAPADIDNKNSSRCASM